MTDPIDLPMPDVEAEPETPTARRRRDQATSVQIGRARVAYLDALATDRALPGRTAALLSIWTRSALATDGRLALPALPPAAAPTDAPVKVRAEAAITPKARVVDQKDAVPGSIPFRTMGVDVQRGHFWVVVRRWSKTGHSRLMAFARIDSWGNVEAFAKQHGVHHALVLVDSGDNTTEVYRETAKRNWKTAKGSGSDDFAVTSKDGQTTRRFYSEKQSIVVPGIPQRATLIVWSNTAGKDLLHGLRARKVWTYAQDAKFWRELMRHNALNAVRDAKFNLSLTQ